MARTRPPVVEVAGQAMAWAQTGASREGGQVLTTWLTGGELTDADGARQRWTLYAGEWRDSYGDIIGAAARVTVGGREVYLDNHATLASACYAGARQVEVLAGIANVRRHRRAKVAA